MRPCPESGGQRHEDERKGSAARQPGDPAGHERSGARRQLGRDTRPADATPLDSAGPPARPDVVPNQEEGGSMTASSSRLALTAAGLRKALGGAVVVG